MRKYLIAVGTCVALMAGVSAGQAAMRERGGGRPPPGTGVSKKPSPGTPHFSVTHAVEQVRQLVQCGNTMYAVGSFDQIIQGGKVFVRHNVFSFKATAPFTVTPWAPTVDGAINSIAFRNGKCGTAYIGGDFNKVDDNKAKNLAEIATKSATLLKRFAHYASAEVETLRAVDGHVIVGGFFKYINGTSADPYMISLNPKTGQDDGFVHLRISGKYEYPGVTSSVTQVYNQALSHSRKLDLVMGDFTSVGGLKRQQIFMLKLTGSKAKVTGWTSPAFYIHCFPDEAFYLRAASWSPDGSTIYTASTGRRVWGAPQRAPASGLCDSAAAFPSRETSVQPKWINYTGCDSLYSTAADGGTAYFGGHERWSMNRLGCNFKGRGGIPATGMEGVSPTNGELYVNQPGTAGYYERSRGNGADDMLDTSAGLWIASDNFGHSQTCGFTENLSGICFLPYG